MDRKYAFTWTWRDWAFGAWWYTTASRCSRVHKGVNVGPLEITWMT
jgi:hypothetical protein